MLKVSKVKLGSSVRWLWTESQLVTYHVRRGKYRMLPWAFFSPSQTVFRVDFDIIGWDPSVSKSNWLHVDIFWFFFIILRYIPLNWLVDSLKSWTSAVISQTQPVHLYLVASSPHFIVHEEEKHLPIVSYIACVFISVAIINVLFSTMNLYANNYY